ncbi:MAG: hypothetical protein K0R83_1, partial [Caulobacter sp.]|nr:hypothetical protein [Caulobacter sp.]
IVVDTTGLTPVEAAEVIVAWLDGAE